LGFLQTLTERELTELVVIPLLEALRFRDIRYTHSPLEYGKDLVFTKEDPLDAVDGRERICATIKGERLSGSVSGRGSVHEVYFQVQQALSEAHVEPFDGDSQMIDKVYVVSPFPITQAAIRSIRGQLQSRASSVYFIDGPYLVSLLNKHCPELLSSLPDPYARYLHGLSRRLVDSNILRQLGSGTQISLADLYTAGHLSASSPEEAVYMTFASPRPASRKLWLREIITDSPYCVVVADVGAGKTTLLLRLASQLATETRATTPKAKRFSPLFVPLHALGPVAADGASGLIARVQQFLAETESLTELTNDPSRKQLLLLDGFDEVPSHHAELCEAVQEVAATMGYGVVVTTRPSRVPALGEPFEYFTLNPFDDQSIADFLNLWFVNRPDYCGKLLDKIKNEPQLLRFCRTPLMLTLFCILASEATIDEIPVRKVDVYERIASLLLEKWDRMRGLQQEYSLGLKQYALERLAFDLQVKRRRTFSRTDFEDSLRVLLRNKRLSRGDCGLFDELVFRSSMVRRNYAGEYEFPHLSFQEYFAARHLDRTADLKAIQSRMYDDWWRNTLAFYFGIRRTLEGVPLPTSKRTGVKGIRLMEYLQEADFTSEEIREKVFVLFAREVLYESAPTADTVVACSRLGEQMLAALRDQVEDSDFRGSTANYLTILASVDSLKGIEMLEQSDHLFERLSSRELTHILIAVVPFLREAVFRRWYADRLREYSSRSRQQQYFEAHRDTLADLKRLRVTLSERYRGAGVSDTQMAALVKRMLEVARMVCSVTVGDEWGSSIEMKGFVSEQDPDHALLVSLAEHVQLAQFDKLLGIAHSSGRKRKRRKRKR